MKSQNQSLLAEVQVDYRKKSKTLDKVTSSEDATNYLRNIWNGINLKESAYALFLNKNNVIIGWYKLSEGGISGTVVDRRILLSVALKTLSSAIIIAHNHPSGSIKPSESDNKLTNQLKSACDIMGIDLLDHLIITDEEYFSYADNRMI